MRTREPANVSSWHGSPPRARPSVRNCCWTWSAVRWPSCSGHTGPESVPADQAFRDLGFSSLTAVEVATRLSRALGAKVPPTLVFDHPTPEAVGVHLAQLLEDRGDAAQSSSEERIRAALNSLPLDTLREAGLLDELLALTEVHEAAASPSAPVPALSPAAVREPAAVPGLAAGSAMRPGGGDATDLDAIDELDSDALIALALGESGS
ncbi:acyl carrier protein [Streptomyces sp. GLT-R25]